MLTKKQKLYDLWSKSKAMGVPINKDRVAQQINLDIRTARRYIKSFEAEYIAINTDLPDSDNAPGEVDDCKFCLERERLGKTISELKREIATRREERLTADDVKKYIIELKDINVEPPEWIIKPDSNKSMVIPSIMISDIHNAEVVSPDQVFGKNEYNMEICEERIFRLCENTVELLRVHINAEYPGIVVNLAGDLLSGDIHEELTATNEKPIMPATIHILGVLVEFLKILIDEFGKVAVFATAGGNHSRTTKKKIHKIKAFTNFDWLIYQLLNKHFQDLGENRIRFFISDGDDIQFKIFNHRYRMIHGDQFRGGQGFIGPFAPITRNDKKKRAAADTYGMGYDTLIIGHFHSLMFLPKVIVNGSVIGYNEFAIDNSYEYEDPQQALWLTHYSRGITGRWPIFCDKIEGHELSKELFKNIMVE